tara:strand:+ start:292 stop:528 length:237 start_codon:yes stop_codon:yes gene_type:complete
MKNITMFLIGFLTCVCIFVIMGQGKPRSKQKLTTNKFQGFAINEDVLFLFNTHNGTTWKSKNGDKWEKVLDKLKRKEK